MSAIEWYYAKGNQQHGPISAIDLRQLADRGELTAEDLVWRAGMEEWVPARRVRGLFDGAAASSSPAAGEPSSSDERVVATPTSPAPGPAAATLESESPQPAPVRPLRTAFERSPAAYERSREGDTQHLFDYLLQGARVRLSGSFVEAAARLFALVGHYGLYAAMAVVLAFHVAWAVKDKSAAAAAAGFASILALALLQYSAGRFSGALEKLDRSTSGRMSSTAFLDCFALLSFLLGLALLVGLTLVGLESKKFSLIVPGVAGCVVSLYAAVVALNPETLRLSITADAKVSEETVGLLTFFAKLGLRLAPVAFGAGVIWGTVMMGRAGYFLFFPPPAAPASQAGDLMGLLSGGGLGGPGPAGDLGGLANLDLSHMSSPLTAGLSALPPYLAAYSSGMWILFMAAALPLSIYFFFLFSYVFIDLLRMFLGIARKLDELVEGKKGEEG